MPIYISSLDPISVDLSLYKLIEIDFTSIPNLKEFYRQASEKLMFPDYFAHNLDSFDEIMCDLDWIDLPVIIKFSNTYTFSSANKENKQAISVLIGSLKFWSVTSGENIILMIDITNQEFK